MNRGTFLQAMVKRSLQAFLVAVAAASIVLEVFMALITLLMSTSSSAMSVLAKTSIFLLLFTTYGGLMAIVFLSWFKWPRFAVRTGFIVCGIQMLYWLSGYLHHGPREFGLDPKTLLYFVWQTSLLPAVCLWGATVLPGLRRDR
jgi:hypothetical protein